MGVDCRITLPGNIRVRDLMTVLGVAVGYKPYKRHFSRPHQDGYSTEIEGKVEWSPGMSPDCGTFNFDGRQVFFTFETECGRNERLLIPKSTPFWCLVGHRLVDFFGGEVCYCDYHDVINYARKRKSARVNAPTNGKEWSAFQDRIAKVKPITKKEMDEFVGANYFEIYEYNYDANGNMVRDDKTRLRVKGE